MGGTISVISAIAVLFISNITEEWPRAARAGEAKLLQTAGPKSLLGRKPSHGENILGEIILRGKVTEI